MSQPALAPVVSGRIVLPSGTSSLAHATLRVVARARPDGRRPDEEHPAVPVQNDGMFSLATADDTTVIQVLGPDGDVLVELAPNGDSPMELRLDETSGEVGSPALVNPTFVDAGALTSIRSRVDVAVAAGELDARAGAAVNGLEQILGTLDDLLPDARLALAGDAVAAQRFRRGLLALPHIGVPPSAAAPAAPDRGADRRWAEFLVAGAVCWIGSDEEDFVELNSALANALDAVHLLDLLLSVPGQASGTMRSMMLSMGGFDGGGFDGGFDGGGLGSDTPGFPGLPGAPKTGGIGGGLIDPWVEYWLHRPKFHWDPLEHRFVWDPPLYVESCIERAIREMAKLRANAPHWAVHSIVDAAACAGQTVVLTGTGFGTSGVVFFTGAGGEVAGATVSWSDTAISVRVPTGAHPGPIRLQIPIGSASFCGGVYPLVRIGQSDVEFFGGLPDIRYLDSDWKNGPIILPDTDAIIDFGYSAAAGVTASLSVWNGTTRIADYTGLTGGAHQLTFHAPATSSPVGLRVEAMARNACGPVNRTLFLTVGVPPKLAVVGMEVIQAVQRPNPLTSGTGLGSALRLAARKRTALRVYVTSGLPSTFSYEAVPSGIAITGTARIGETAVAPMAAYTALTAATRLTALVFELPWPACTGVQPISVTVRPASAAPGLSGFTATRSMTSAFDPQSPLRLLRMRVRDDHYGLPAPTIAEWNTSTQGARDRFPIAEDGIVIYTAPGWDEFGTDHDLNTDDGWEDLLDDIDDIADDFTDIGQVWAATVPNSGAYALNGLAHAPFDRIWPLDDDYRAMLARATRQASFPHEAAHTFGIAHSPGGGADDPDTSLPAVLEPDVIGWRASDNTTFPPGWADLMSYITPVGGTYQDRWPSAELWNRLFDRLN